MHALTRSCLALALACGGGSGDGDGGGETTDSGTETTGESTETGDGTETTESGETGDGTVTWSGIVKDFYSIDPDNPDPIAGAEISVIDLPGFETISATDGTWELAGLPANQTILIKIEDSGDYWGAVVPMAIGDVDATDVDLAQVSVEAISVQEGVLQMQDPAFLADPTKAVFLAAVRQNSATGTTVTMDPMPPSGNYYAPDESGNPVLDLNVASWFFRPLVVFANLEPGDADDYTVHAEHPERDCTVLVPNQPSFARHINLFEIDCPPMG
jgi:hypothetical protein